MMQALKATGVVRGFNARAEGAVLSLGPGLAYIDGAELHGGWKLDFTAEEDGWHFVRMNGLPMYLLLMSGGRIAALRDIRRWIMVTIVYDGGLVMLNFGTSVVVQRVVSALRGQNPKTGQLSWVPLPGGQVTMHPVEMDLAMNVKATSQQTSAVLVEYTLTEE